MTAEQETTPSALAVPEPRNVVDILAEAGLDPEVVRALYVAHLKSYASKEEKFTRPAMKQRERFATPGKTPFRAPDGRPLGEIQREDPPPKWTITDRAALRAHLETDPGNFTTSEELDADPEDLIALVRQHRPEWLQPVRHLRPGLEEAALKQVKESGKAVPGITLHRPEGDLVIRADKGAGEVFADLIREGLMNPDGTTPEVEPIRRRPAVETRLPELGTRITTRMKDEADDAYDRGEEWWDPEPDPFAGLPSADPFAGIPATTRQP